MKRIVTLIAMAIMALGCSKSEKGSVEPNPYLPIADLVMPREVVAGEDVVMTGKGFLDGDRIYIRLNGESRNTLCSISSINSSSLSFNVSSTFASGIYSVMLRRDGVTMTIGGVNIVAGFYNPNDFEVWTVRGSNLDLRPTSIKNQVSGASLVSLAAPSSLWFANVVVIPDGKIFHANFIPTSYINGYRGKIKQGYIMGCYDPATGTNRRFGTSGIIDGIYAWGLIGEDLHVLMTTNYITYTLHRWDMATDLPSSSVVKTFDFTGFADDDGGLPFYENDGKFEYDSATQSIILSGNMGRSEMAMVNLSLNTTTGVVKQNGSGVTNSCWFFFAEGQLYCFAVEEVNEVPQSRLMRIDNADNWNMTGTGATLLTTVANTSLVYPAYSPETGLVYCLNSGGEQRSIVYAFDLQANNLVSKRWMGSGVQYLFYTPAPATTPE